MSKPNDEPKAAPREFWLEFGGDPSDDKEVYKRYCAQVPFECANFSDEVIHVIEMSAYQALQAELEQAKEEIAELKRRLDEWPMRVADSITYLHQVENKNALYRSALEEWITWENEQIKKEGPYVGKEINRLIEQGRAALKGKV